MVYLTFDDGPHPSITPWVMNELNKVGAKGTFFVVGDNVEKFSDVISELRSNGHAIGNHTQHHTKGWKVTKDEYLQEIQECQEKIGESSLFRPPYGQISFKASKDILQNYEVVMWDILTKDYLKTLGVNRAQRRIQRLTTPGSVVVFHDSEKAEKNLKALLPEYLRFLKKEGYQMNVL